MENNDLLLISDYLAGDLSGAERQAFEERLGSEPELALTLRRQQAQQDVVRAIDRARQKEALKAMLQQGRSAPVRRLNPAPLMRWGALAAAAAVALLVWIAWPQNPALSPQQMALGYMEAYPMEAERGEATSQLTAWDSVALYYGQGDYVRALPPLRELHLAAPADARYSLYLSECLMQTGAYAEAIPLLEQIPAQNLYHDAARWRLALCYLLDGKPEMALPLLEEIRSSNHYRKLQADTLLRQIK